MGCCQKLPVWADYPDVSSPLLQRAQQAACPRWLAWGSGGPEGLQQAPPPWPESTSFKGSEHRPGSTHRARRAEGMPHLCNGPRQPPEGSRGSPTASGSHTGTPSSARSTLIPRAAGSPRVPVFLVPGTRWKPADYRDKVLRCKGFWRSLPSTGRQSQRRTRTSVGSAGGGQTSAALAPLHRPGKKPWTVTASG